MPEFQPVSSAHISAIERPSCLACGHHRMLLSKLETTPSGLHATTFECQKCGRIHTDVISDDPMTSWARGWPARGSRPPT